MDTDRDILIDDSLLDGEEDPEEERVAAEQQAEEEEVREGILDEYLEGIKNTIVQDIARSGKPKCYKAGTFWMRPRDPIFALDEALRSGLLSPNELYHMDIFVWLPNLLPGAPTKFICECGAGMNLNGKLLLVCYSTNPTARRVKDLHGDYLLFTNRFRCPERRVNERGCGTSYQGTHPNILAQLPRQLQNAFPAYLSARGAIDKRLMSVMRTTFATRFGPAPFAALLSEMRSQQHSDRELTYLAACADAMSSRRLPTPPVPFSTFKDKQRYAGTYPTQQYCKGVFVDWMEAHKVFMDRVNASLPGRVLKSDHTFKLMKSQARLLGQPSHVACYTSVNEFEQARKQVFTLSKNMDLLIGYYDEIQMGLSEHGHPPTEYAWTDNAQAELSFHERATKSLAQHVQHIVRDPWSELPDLSLPPSAIVKYYDVPDLIDSACCSIIAPVLDENSGKLIAVTLNIQCEPQSGVAQRSGTQATASRLVDIIQISSNGMIYLFKVVTDIEFLPPNLCALLLSEKVLKAGQSIRRDLELISKAWRLPELRQYALSSTSLIVELGLLAKLKGASAKSSLDFPALIGTVLRLHLPRDDSMQVSRWSNSSLTPAQKQHAALEGHALWCLWDSLRSRPSCNLPLNKISVGQLATLYAGKKPVAIGEIPVQPPSLKICFGDSDIEKSVKISSSIIVFTVTKVLIPGYVIDLHQKTLDAITTDSLPADIAVHVGSLRSRVPEQPVDDTARETSTAVVRPPEVIDGGKLEGKAEMNDSEEDESDEESDDEIESDVIPVQVETPESESVQTPVTEPEIDEFEDKEFDALISSVPDYQARTGYKSLPTRVMDDHFHYIDRLLRKLSRRHSGYKPFARQFSRVLYVPDKSDQAAVKAVYSKKGISWEYALRAHADAINKRIRRHIPPPEKLVPGLKTLFESWKDVRCSVKPRSGPLFSTQARKQADQLIKVAELGLISDPPDVQMYYRRGVDKDKLVIYRTIRGTSSVEGAVHMPMRRTMGSMHASPELTDSLLTNVRHRRNQTVGYFNRTGQKYYGHFDFWIYDEISELSMQTGIAASFPIPDILTTRIATSESFGYMAFPVVLCQRYGITSTAKPAIQGIPHHHGTPVHLLSHLSTAIPNTYDFLSNRQKTKHAITTIHTRAEFSQFNELIQSARFFKTNAQKSAPDHSFKTVDYDALSRAWNTLVDSQSGHQKRQDRIFYKIPEQLERHYKVWAESRAETATRTTNAKALAPVNALINDPERHTTVQPPRPVPAPVSVPVSGPVTGMYVF
ncbi:hypothetical protein C8J56DRAFT_780924 [Mycena floridula]|nr:hypothetical protein C8J56DRAFT_780924 [Mycena floridula]